MIVQLSLANREYVWKPGSLTVHEDGTPLKLSGAADEGRDQVGPALNRRRVDQAVVAARLVIIGEPPVVE